MITLLTLNIHQEFHEDRVRALVRERMPDVLCLQEALKPFVDDLTRELGYQYIFSFRTSRPAHVDADSHAPIEEGTVIAWRDPVSIGESKTHTYNDPENPALLSTPNECVRSLMTAQLKYQGELYRIGVTHFTWTPDGSASDEQRADMACMLDVLSGYHDEGIVFCGDFNAPRGGEIFAMMSGRYTDNLPPHILTTLDQNLHRAPLDHRRARAVDSIFSTKEYIVRNVVIEDGVSDHVALFAEVSKSVC